VARWTIVTDVPAAVTLVGSLVVGAPRRHIVRRSARMVSYISGRPSRYPGMSG
jgi:hypothetical protein